MYFTYILKSLNSDRFYVGMSQDTVKRLQEHNAGKTTSTKAYIPWVMVYQEEFATREAAREREVYLKSAAGRRWRKQNLNI